MEAVVASGEVAVANMNHAGVLERGGCEGHQHQPRLQHRQGNHYRVTAGQEHHRQLEVCRNALHIPNGLPKVEELLLLHIVSTSAKTRNPLDQRVVEVEVEAGVALIQFLKSPPKVAAQA